jgi:hypothetical protein
MSDTAFILVKSGRTDNKVVLWERDARHPHDKSEEFGEVWVDGTQENPVLVYPTEAVMNKLASKELVEVREEKPAPKAAPEKTGDKK